MAFMQTMLAIQKATREAKIRTGDIHLATRAEAGKLQIVRVVPKGTRGDCDVIPMSEYLPISDAICALKALYR